MSGAAAEIWGPEPHCGHVGSREWAMAVLTLMLPLTLLLCLREEASLILLGLG